MASKSDKIRKLKEKAQKYLAREKYEDAMEVYRDAVRLSPGDLSLRQKLAEQHARLGNVREAVREYQTVAGSYAADGLLLKAIAISKVLLNVDPDHRETQETLAKLYAERRTGFSKVALPKAMSPAVQRSAAAPKARVIELGAVGTPVESVQAAKKEYHLADVEVVEVESLIEEASEVSLEEELESSEGFEIDIDEVEVSTAELPPIPLFSELEPSAFLALSEKMELISAQKGDVIVAEGEVGASMYIIIQGEVDIIRTDEGERVSLAKLNDGAFFGEMALLSDAPRSASVIALEETMLFEVSKAMMDDMIDTYPSVEKVMRRFHQTRLLSNLLKTSPLFVPFGQNDKLELIEKFQSKRVGAGKVLITKERAGDALYLLLTGRCDVLTTDDAGADVRLAELKDGDVFGEMSMLFRSASTASVRTTTPCVVLRMVRSTFNELIMTHPQVLEALSELSDERIAENKMRLGPDEPLDNEFLL